MPLELLSSFYESLLSSLRGCKAICSRLSALAAVLAVVVAAAVVVVVAVVVVAVAAAGQLVAQERFRRRPSS
jgi:hypothetical protein